MTKSDSNAWLWFIVRRCLVQLLLGALMGAVWGAVCVGLSGALVGAVIDMGPPQPYIGDSMWGIGGLLGVAFGGIAGGAIGALGFAVVGVIAPPSRLLWPPRKVILPMLLSMAIFTVLALSCYFGFNAGFAAFGWNYVEATTEHVLIALFGVPAIMGIGQIIGIWRGVIKTRQKKQAASPVSI